MHQQRNTMSQKMLAVKKGNLRQSCGNSKISCLSACQFPILRDEAAPFPVAIPEWTQMLILPFKTVFNSNAWIEVMPFLRHVVLVIAGVAFCATSEAQTSATFSDQKSPPNLRSKRKLDGANPVSSTFSHPTSSRRRPKSQVASLPSRQQSKRVDTHDQQVKIVRRIERKQLGEERKQLGEPRVTQKTAKQNDVLKSSRRSVSNHQISKQVPAGFRKSDSSNVNLSDQPKLASARNLLKPLPQKKKESSVGYAGARETLTDRVSSQPQPKSVPTRVASLTNGVSALPTVTKLVSPLVPASPSTPVSPGTGLKLGALSGANFKSPKSFLSNKNFKFSNASKFLKTEKAVDKVELSFGDKPEESLGTANKPVQKSATVVRSGRNNKVPAMLPSAKKVTRRTIKARTLPSNRVISNRFTDDDDERANINRYLTVKSVDDPIVANPFAEIKQQDDIGLLNESRPAPPLADGMSYSTLTGYYEQAHLATYRAHNFKHRPLYFEEVNLERYGNQLPMQNVISAAHFFTSAGLLPYQFGANPPNCCVSTLGHKRPGDCVPYQRHRWPRSVKGLFYQGLAITAISL